MDYIDRETEELGENTVSVTLCPSLGTNPDLRGEGPATNRLSHGTAKTYFNSFFEQLISSKPIKRFDTDMTNPDIDNILFSTALLTFLYSLTTGVIILCYLVHYATQLTAARKQAWGDEFD